MLLQGRRVVIAGVSDTQGIGWAIVRAVAEHGASDIIVGAWVPAFRGFRKRLNGRHSEALLRLPNGTNMPKPVVFPLDVRFDTMCDVPASLLEDTRYLELYNGLPSVDENQTIDNLGFSISDMVARVERDFGVIDCLVHAIGYSAKPTTSLLGLPRVDYLEALSISSYSFSSMIAKFGPLFRCNNTLNNNVHQDGSAICLTFEGSHRVVRNYGGGLSSAKAALESDIKYIAVEAGERWGIRVNALSPGPILTRASSSLKNIDVSIEKSRKNSPTGRGTRLEDVGNAAVVLLSPISMGITGVTLPCDSGAHLLSTYN